MIRGEFFENIPLVKITIGWEGMTNVKTASGNVVGLPTSVLTASLEGNSEYVHANISNGSQLVGIGFLTKFGYKAIVDCKKRTVSLEKS